MRLVADTNVVVSALLWRGTPYVLFKAAEEHELEFFTSRVLLDELDEVLARRKLAKAIRATGLPRAELFKDYQELAQIVTPAQTRRIVLADRDDDAVVACALAAHADLIVSGDRRLRDIKSYQGISIVAPADALKRIPQH
ncbi:MAG: putative toxin-antitoxin system toxin component, PIN family [Betaproteobacteria bacterium]|nr:putative toxin-antitoxin system toxin component, PIN family [Betaproteobacteria bacterium]